MRLLYTISSELDHRMEIDIKDARIKSQQELLQKWEKLKPKVDALQEEHNLIWKKLNAAKAAALACEQMADNGTIEEPSENPGAPDAPKSRVRHM